MDYPVTRYALKSYSLIGLVLFSTPVSAIFPSYFSFLTHFSYAFLLRQRKGVSFQDIGSQVAQFSDFLKTVSFHFLSILVMDLHLVKRRFFKRLYETES